MEWRGGFCYVLYGTVYELVLLAMTNANKPRRSSPAA